MKYCYYAFAFLLLVCLGCEKPIITDEKAEKQEQTSKGDSSSKDSGNKSGGGDKDDGGSKGNSDDKENNDSDDSDDSDYTEWEEVDTSEKNSYEEKDFKDGDTDNGEDPEERHTVDYFLTEPHLDGGVWVVGYIVGACKATINKPGNIEQKPPFTIKTSLLLADNPNETDVTNMITIQLPAGAIRDKFNLVDHPENLHRRAEFFGYRGTYLYAPGIKGPASYGWAD